jgi:peroxiredoxin
VTRDFEKVEILGVHVGRSAPDFAASTVDGEPLRLADLRGKVVLIDFWATWCAPCVREMPNVEKAYTELAADGFVVVGVSLDDSAETVKRFRDQRKLPWKQVWAEGGAAGELAKKYNVTAVPATFLIGPDGKVVGKDLRGKALLDAARKEVSKLRGGGAGAGAARTF